MVTSEEPADRSADELDDADAGPRTMSALESDRGEADQIAWDQALEGRPLTPDGYAALLGRVVEERQRARGALP